MNEAVTIVAGGWSVSEFDLRPLRQERHRMLIGVNDASLYLPVDIAFTMDRLWLENRYALLRTLGVERVVVRKGVGKNVKLNAGVFEYDHRGSGPLSMDAGLLVGNNSGACAINMAAQLRPEVIFLLGFDMQAGPNREPYWYPPYSWAPQQGSTGPGKYRDWTKEFANIATFLDLHNITAYTVGERSAVQNFERISYERFLKLTAFP